MMALLRLLVLRRFGQERRRTVLTLLGVALGVAVFTGIRLASRSALASFADSVDAVTGRANLEVASTSDGFAESVYARVARMPGIDAAAPVVQVTALAHPGAPRGDAAPAGEHGPWNETLTFLGVDPLAEAPFVRGLAAEDSPRARAAAGASALRLLATPRAAAVPRSLATRLRLREGDTLTVLASGAPEPLVVAAILEAPGLQQAMGGNFALLDIATAQDVFRRVGRLDRIDLLVAPARREAVRAALARALPPDAVAEAPRARTRQVEDMVSAFELNLAALSFIALFVSMFLIFNAVALSVLRRRREIGILRGLGATRGEVLGLFLAEGMVLGSAGSALGLALGTLLARGALGAVGRTLADLYQVQTSGGVRLDPATYGAGFALGLAAAFLSSLAPALEASWTPPGDVMRQGALLEARRLPVARAAFAGLACLGLAAAAAWGAVEAHVPWGGFAAAFLVVAGFALLAPAATLGCERLAARPAAAWWGIEGALGARYLRESLARAAAVVASLMLAAGMMVALEVMVGSFRRTVDTWITQTIRGDLYIEPIGHRVSQGATVMPDSLVAAAGRLPGVVAVDTYRATRIRYAGRIANAIGIDFAVQRRVGHLAFLGGADGRSVLGRALARGEVLATESFAHHHRLATGDTIALATPAGLARLRVAGVFYDYTTDAGAVFMDRELFARLWRDHRTESLALYCRPGTDPGRVRAAFLALAGPAAVYAVTPNQALRRRVLDVFDHTFRITFALQIIAVIVAVLGVVTTLTALILQRGREIGVLRAIGALASQVRTLVLVESALLGVAGSALGCAAGWALALVLVHVINKQYFGWTIRISADPWIFVRTPLLMVTAATLAGLGPSRLAARQLASRAMRADG